MSNYNARSRAIRAEKAALRCERMVDDMYRQTKYREQILRGELQKKFEIEHAAIIEQNRLLLEQCAELAKNKPMIVEITK